MKIVIVVKGRSPLTQVSALTLWSCFDTAGVCHMVYTQGLDKFLKDRGQQVRPELRLDLLQYGETFVPEAIPEPRKLVAQEFVVNLYEQSPGDYMYQTEDQADRNAGPRRAARLTVHVSDDGTVDTVLVRL